MNNEIRVYYEIRPTSFSVKINEVDVGCVTHIHEDMEILYMRDGVQNITVDGKEYAVQKGEAAVIFPGCVHNYFCKTEPQPADAVLIICSAKFYNTFLPDLTNLSILNLQYKCNK